MKRQDIAAAIILADRLRCGARLLNALSLSLYNIRTEYNDLISPEGREAIMNAAYEVDAAGGPSAINMAFGNNPLVTIKHELIYASDILDRILVNISCGAVSE